MLVTIGSLTTATRASNTIKKALGIDVRVVHTPVEINKGGCSYSIRFSENYMMSVKRVVKEYRIPVRKWYGESISGAERVYNDLS